MKESGLWNYLRTGMMGRWHPTRIESSAGNGVPDVSYGMHRVNGWLELKHEPSWPVRDGTKVRLKLRPEQKHWIASRGSLAGHVWVLLRVQDDFFLLDWQQALLAVGGWTREEWYWMSHCRWNKKIDFTELTQQLMCRSANDVS